LQGYIAQTNEGRAGQRKKQAEPAAGTDRRGGVLSACSPLLLRLGTAQQSTRIDALFSIEREINGSPPQERRHVRQERSKLLVEAFGRWLRKHYGKVSPNGKTGKAIAYSLNCWDALVRFLDDGRLCMSNNAAE
jgi:hypothetical protein